MIAISKAFYSKLFAWLLLGFVGSYFLISFDREYFMESSEPRAQVFFKSLKIPSLNLGIDLQGGVYLVLGLDLDKAVERKSQAAAKAAQDVLKTQDVSCEIGKVQKEGIPLSFSSEEKAQEAYSILVENYQGATFEKGGNKITLKLPEDEVRRVRTGAVEQAVTVLSTRLDAFDVQGIVVQPHGDRQVIVQMPGVKNVDQVKLSIAKTAQLDFKIVERQGSYDSIMDYLDGYLPASKMLVPDQSQEGKFYLVDAIPEVTGDDISDAFVNYDEFHRPAVGFRLTKRGAQKFKRLTGENIGKQLGIVMDGKMVTAPEIRSEIGAEGSITSRNYTPQEAGNVAALLKSGALLAPISIEQEYRVGETLGQDSIKMGLLSCGAALLILLFFSLLYYKIPGLLAFCALLYNLFLMTLILSFFRATLTLPGIAGMVLTIGMAIDASILIYERIKEELFEGVSFKNAVEAGFNGSMTVILDSNITTFLTGAILFYFGGPAIKGFAVTLMVGIVATVLAGVYFLKAIYDFIIYHTSIQKLKF